VLTFSAGLAVLDPKKDRPAERVLKEADEALYRAKDQGRNRVKGASSQPS
jgi:PleD family two-component response regulator